MHMLCVLIWIYWSSEANQMTTHNICFYKEPDNDTWLEYMGGNYFE